MENYKTSAFWLEVKKRYESLKDFCICNTYSAFRYHYKNDKDFFNTVKLKAQIFLLDNKEMGVIFKSNPDTPMHFLFTFININDIHETKLLEFQRKVRILFIEKMIKDYKELEDAQQWIMKRMRGNKI